MYLIRNCISKGKSNDNIIDSKCVYIDFYSLQCGWEHIFTQERQKLKPNDISVLKCFVLNRLSYEYSKVRTLHYRLNFLD